MADLDVPFFIALARSIGQAALAGGVSLLFGWPAGIATGIWDFPGRRVLVPLLALPILLPSFLVAIGLSLLWPRLAGLGAAVWAFGCIGAPLVFFAALAATRAVTSGQADAARLAGGEGLLFRLAMRGTWPLASLAALLAAVLTLAEVGPGQIFGWHGAANELLISFAARYDRELATQQALIIAGVAAVLTWPSVCRIAPVLTSSLFSRDTRPLSRTRRAGAAIPLGGLAALVVLCPIAGLLRPLAGRTWPIARAWSEVTRTAGDTLVYAILAAALAVSIGFIVAAAAQCSARFQRLAVLTSLGLFAMPPILIALSFISISSRWTVGVALAVRCLPVAVLFGLRAFGSMPDSWAEAGKVHGVGNATMVGRIFVPWVARWAAPAAVLAALIATAEVGVVLLLHPPGHGTLPLAIFTVMANAPEALVAMLCLLYVALAALLGFMLIFTRRTA